MLKQLTYFTTSFILIFSVVFLLSSCGKDDVVNNNTNPPEPVDTSSFEYPFTNGSYWNYTKTYSVENIRPDSIRYRFNSYPLTGTGHSEILPDDTTLAIGGTVKIIYDMLIYGNDTTASRFYYTNSSYSMVCYGYRGGSTPEFPYRKSPGIKFSSDGRLFNSLNELSSFIIYGNDFASAGDTFIQEDPVIVVLKYPVVRGTEWLFKDFGLSTIRKKYISFENYHLDTAVISCIKTQRIHSAHNEYVFYDYYSKYGQMKRDYLFKNALVTNQFGHTIGYVDYRDVYTVTSFYIASK
jgi:hypothetical protein